MRYLAILLLIILFGCDSLPVQPSTSISPDSSFAGNVSFLLGYGDKNVTDSSTGITHASNIFWKDSLGTRRSLENLRGKVIILNFFADWCGPCNHEMPDFMKVADSLASKVAVIAVAVDDGDSTYRTLTSLYRYAEIRQITFQIISDPHQKAYSNFGAKDVIPWTFIIDRKGNVVHTERGMFDSLKVLTDIIDKIP